MAISRKSSTPVTKTGRSNGKNKPTHEQIALLAYLKAEARGFSPGHELDDWLEAEKEVNGGSGSRHQH